MVSPTLWGPAIWQVMFACAWHCPKDAFDTLCEMLFDTIPQLLPCEKCRRHVVQNSHRATSKSGGRPRTPAEAFAWLWFFKNAVNESLKPRRASAVSLVELTERYQLNGGVVDDVALADTLVLVALEATRENNQEIFRNLAAALAVLLPLPADAYLRKTLATAAPRRSIVSTTVQAARGARHERGLPKFSLAHYEKLIND